MALFGSNFKFGDFASKLGGALQDLDGSFGKGNLQGAKDQIAQAQQKAQRQALLKQATQGMSPQQAALAQLNPQAFSQTQIGNQFQNPLAVQRQNNNNLLTQNTLQNTKFQQAQASQPKAPKLQEIFDPATGRKVKGFIDPQTGQFSPVGGVAAPSSPLVNVNTGQQGRGRLVSDAETKALGLPQGTVAQFDHNGNLKIIQDSKHPEQTKGRAALTAMHGAVGDIGGKVNAAIDQSNQLNTGTFGRDKNPFAKGQDLTATLETIQADAAFGALQEMRDNSKTGGALGQVSERELGLLSAAKEAIHRSQSEQQLDANLKKYSEIRERALANVQAAYEEEYGTPFQPLSNNNDDDNDPLGILK